MLFASITKIRVICTYVHRTSNTLRVGQKFAYRIHNGICFIFWSCNCFVFRGGSAYQLIFVNLLAQRSTNNSLRGQLGTIERMSDDFSILKNACLLTYLLSSSSSVLKSRCLTLLIRLLPLLLFLLSIFCCMRGWENKFILEQQQFSVDDCNLRRGLLLVKVTIFEL